MRPMIFTISFFLAILAFIFSSCSSREESKNSVKIPISTEEKVREAWELEWERTVEKGKKEGKVVISTGRGPEVRNIIGGAFKDKYGIAIDWMAGRGAQLVARLLSERRAGLYNLDLMIEGTTSLIMLLKPQGALDDMRPQFILPELKDEKDWILGKFPFLDKDFMVFGMVLYEEVPLFVNTNMISRDEITSYKDLLNPKFKGGKIVMENPTVPGNASNFFGVMTDESFGPVLGLDYMKKLAQQDLIISMERRQVAEWLLKGKYFIALSVPLTTLLDSFRAEGIPVPVAGVTPKEGNWLTSGGSNLVLVNKAPNPNAAKVFINWLLSREGQILWSKTQLAQSSRIDIPNPEDINPDMRRRVEGRKYITFISNEDYLQRKDIHEQRARDIFGSLLR